MRLLLDTDAFCVLAAADLLDHFVDAIPVDSCCRLPALPYMLRRGGLRERIGGEIADQLIPMAEAIPALRIQDYDLNEDLVSANAIDPGEAQLFSAAIQDGDLVLTGDKRALRELREFPSICGGLANHIIPLEAALAKLHDVLGQDTLWEKLTPSRPLNIVVRICFSEGIEDVRECLQSYLDVLSGEVAPLTLWKP